MEIKVRLSPVGVVAAFILLWQLLPTYNIVNRYILVPFTQVIASYPELMNPANPVVPGGLLFQLQATLFEVAVAFGLSATIGVVVGFLLGHYRLVGSIYEPLLYLFYAVPGAVLYPPIFLLFGVGVQSKIAIALILGLFPMIINTATGVRNVKHSYIKLANSLGVKGSQMMTKVVIPAAAPYIMSGLRLSLSFVLVGVIFGELIASTQGLGWAIESASNTFHIDMMYALILVVVLVALLLLLILTAVERRLIRYA